MIYNGFALETSHFQLLKCEYLSHYKLYINTLTHNVWDGRTHEFGILQEIYWSVMTNDNFVTLTEQYSTDKYKIIGPTMLSLDPFVRTDIPKLVLVL